MTSAFVSRLIQESFDFGEPLPYFLVEASIVAQFFSDRGLNPPSVAEARAELHRRLAALRRIEVYERHPNGPRWVAVQFWARCRLKRRILLGYAHLEASVLKHPWNLAEGAYAKPPDEPPFC